MNQVAQDIVLLLMRLHVNELINSSNDNAELLHAKSVKVIDELSHPQDKKTLGKN